jgi:ribonucleoside-diphosphate reductase alpha chain
MSSFRFTPAGRTLANAGAKTSLVANCVVLHIEDSLDGIYQTKKDAVLLQQAGSGIGFPLHMLRPAGTVAIRTQGVASGPMSFLHAFNYDFSVIKQHNRSGANMAVMRVDHPDILEFIHCKDREGSIKNFNVSVGITDDFMNRVCGFSPDDAPWMCEFEGVKCLPRRIIRVESVFDPPLFLSAQEVEMSAREIFDEILDCAWNKGEPGCVFMDTVERSNPLPGLGRIEACNPCGTYKSLPLFFCVCRLMTALTDFLFLLSLSHFRFTQANSFCTTEMCAILVPSTWNSTCATTELSTRKCSSKPLGLP